jgi:glycosyltransferase involved in cell wall biosynthesis
MEAYIGETLQSIINQHYDNLELIIVDGNSTDNTMAIVNQYRDSLSIIISEPDQGQYDAINKGMRLATGDVLAWLNADDIYFPWTLKTVARVFNDYPQVDWISGMSAFIDNSGNLLNIYNTINARPSALLARGYFRKNLYGYLQQESMFWRRDLWNKAGGLDLQYKLAADFELWTRFARYSDHVTIGLPLAGFRLRADSRSKANEDKYYSEVLTASKKLPKTNFIVRKLTSSNQVINKLIRLLIWKKAWIYYYSVSRQKWILANKRRPVGSVSFSQLLLEK